jgi:hypothetical protein
MSNKEQQGSDMSERTRLSMVRNSGASLSSREQYEILATNLAGAHGSDGLMFF